MSSMRLKAVFEKKTRIAVLRESLSLHTMVFLLLKFKIGFPSGANLVRWW